MKSEAFLAGASGNSDSANDDGTGPRARRRKISDGVITIRADGLRNDKGDVMCTLCSSADGYPGDCKHKVTVKASIMNKHADCVFPHKAPGDYGATIFHDEDSDGKFKRNFIWHTERRFRLFQ